MKSHPHSEILICADTWKPWVYVLQNFVFADDEKVLIFEKPPITYYWTVPLILDHPYLVGKLASSKIADTKVSRF